MTSLYDILQVHPRVNPEVLKVAYHALVKIYHPDKGERDGRIFRQIVEAYNTLSDPEKRAKYDQREQTISSRPGKIIGDYRIIEKIAEGGFGKTYKAEHTRLGTFVCIKHCPHISPEVDTILEQEARAVWDLRHYAIPAMRDLLRLDDGTSALVMSYIEGPTLAQIIEKNGRIDPEHVAWIMQRVLNALQYMHFQGVVHGDIKPQNIIVQPEKHMAVLVDYGLAMVKPRAEEKSIGYTELYSPPEQRRGAPLIPETDLYSLGMTAIFALTNSPERLRRREAPDTVPTAMRDFLRMLVAQATLSRPNWQKMDLCDHIAKVREQSFGRTRSNMKTLAF